MSDTIITIRGFVATEVTSGTTTGGTATASFRIASTSRRRDKEGVWGDDHTNWFLVQGYRHLAGNMGCSIKKGHPVIVTGKLRIRSWERDGRVYYSHTIDAESVGHDLTLGTANFTRSSSKPVLSLVETETSAGAEHRAGLDEPFYNPEDGDEELEGGEPAAAFVEDADGNLVPVDLETGELAEARV